RLLLHWERAAASRTFWMAGRSSPIRTAMIAITTSNSMSVNPERVRRTRGGRMKTSSEEREGEEGKTQRNNLCEHTGGSAAAKGMDKDYSKKKRTVKCLQIKNMLANSLSFLPSFPRRPEGARSPADDLSRVVGQARSSSERTMYEHTRRKSAI